MITRNLASIEFAVIPFHTMAIAKFIATLLTLLVSLTSAWAHDFTLKNAHIVHPVATPTVPAQANGGVNFTLENTGTNAVRLVRAASPIAAHVELHQMSMDGNIARMRSVPGIEVKGGQAIRMEPTQGYHLMLVSLRQPLKEGGKFPMILEFESIGSVEVSVLVAKAKEGAADEEHHH